MLGRLWIFALILAFSASVSRAEETAAAEPPSAKAFLAQEKPGDFIPIAKAWLAAHPTGEKSAQVAEELLMVATLVKDAAEIRSAKLRLIAEHPSSLTATFLMSQMQLDGYSTFLYDCFGELDWEQETLGRKWLNQAMETGSTAYGPKFADDSRLVQAALTETDPAKATAYRSSVRTLRPEAVAILDVALNKELAAAEKLRRLRQLKDSGVVFYMRLLYGTELTAEERNSPELAGIVAERLLKEQKFSQVEALLSRVCEKTKDARLIYFLAWAQGAAGKHEIAAAGLQKVVTDFPNSPWAKPAGELLPAVRELRNNLEAHEDGLAAAMTALGKKVPEVVEIRLQTGPRIKPAMTAYVAIDMPVESVEIHLSKDRETVAAARASRTLDRIYLKGDQKIRTFADGPSIPYFAPRIQKKPSGNWSFDYRFADRQEGNPLMGNFLSLLSSVSLSLLKSGSSPLEFAVKEGRFPAAVINDSGERRYRWLTPSAERPELLAIEVRLDNENRISGMDWGDLYSIQIRSGNEGEVNLKLPKWPELATSDNESSPLAAVGELFGVALNTWTDFVNATNGSEELADKKDAQRR